MYESSQPISKVEFPCISIPIKHISSNKQWNKWESSSRGQRKQKDASDGQTHLHQRLKTFPTGNFQISSGNWLHPPSLKTKASLWRSYQKSCPLCKLTSHKAGKKEKSRAVVWTKYLQLRFVFTDIIVEGILYKEWIDRGICWLEATLDEQRYPITQRTPPIANGKTTVVLLEFSKELYSSFWRNTSIELVTMYTHRWERNCHHWHAIEVTFAWREVSCRHGERCVTMLICDVIVKSQ